MYRWPAFSRFADSPATTDVLLGVHFHVEGDWGGWGARRDYFFVGSLSKDFSLLLLTSKIGCAWNETGQPGRS